MPWRKERGQTGGVRKLVYLCGALLPSRSDPADLPVFRDDCTLLHHCYITIPFASRITPHHVISSNLRLFPLSRLTRTVISSNHQGERTYPRTPLTILFHRFPATEAGKQAVELSWQPATCILKVSTSTTVRGKTFPASTYAARKTGSFRLKFSIRSPLWRERGWRAVTRGICLV